MDDSNAIKGFILAFLIGAVLVFVVLRNSGLDYPLSTPIDHLESGQLYEVTGITRTEEYCYLTLRAEADDKIRFYRLELSKVPLDLEIGDGLIKTTSGLTRLPQEFSKP